MSNVICITGVTSGIGRAAALLFAARGWKVAGTGRRKERLDELHCQLGDAFLPLAFDIGDRNAVLENFSALPPEFAAIDVLFCNAGISLAGRPVHEADIDDLETMIKTNMNGVLYCCRAVIPGMVRRGHGHVVTMGSYSATWPNPGTNVYAASKAFVRLLTYDLREDLVGTPLRTTCIIPAVTQTEFPLARMKGDTRKAEKHFEHLDPIQPSDVAETLWWAVNMPERVNVSEIRLSPTRQTYGAANMYREPFFRD
ncbi:SDR family NAD(P)-dependent oxidoreductase [Mailhella massiliensis]|uniref:SDR family NAD(P)-dependent oxidoreductase n=1 Tax=Mailhella massiliensis TaxID=1903261 RepID=A0A921AXY6_9BACT|nr:SDR family NAD(P)-dependent oxidoreductase [Mailhella massiliensis]HJD97951.1 SDR family NAD(P)-dependent oxidoreductase [Mailhella massiliensis]